MLTFSEVFFRKVYKIDVKCPFVVSVLQIIQAFYCLADYFFKVNTSMRCASMLNFEPSLFPVRIFSAEEKPCVRSV